jgi:phospholipase/carboxylesterase
MRIDDDHVLWSTPENDRSDRPLLLLLHGHGMDERVGFDLRHHLPPSLVVASLRAPARARGGYGWFALDATFQPHQIDTAAEAVLTWLDHQDGYSSVGVVGFSQGSAIAAQCLRIRPAQFACAVLLSGFLSPLPAPGDQELTRIRPPVFSGRGDADPLVPAPLVTLTEQWLAAHTALTQSVYPGLGHNVSTEELADLATFLRQHLI